MRTVQGVEAVFDDPSLIGTAGLVPVMRLAEDAGLHEALDTLTVDCPNPVLKATSVIAGMLAGADSIDDLDLLRHGGMGRVFTGTRAPSTLGTFLRSFTFGHLRQLDAASKCLLTGLVERVPGLLAGTGPGGLVLVDVDDTIRAVHGYAKQGAAYGYSGVKGLNAQVATISSPICAPVVAAARLRAGNTASATGGGRLLGHAVRAARAAGATGQVLARADSAYYQHQFISAATGQGAWFSVTARMDPAVTAAISRIPQDAWRPIRYPHAIWENDSDHPDGGYWVSDAHVAETEFVAFTSRRARERVPCRLVVRRVKRLQPLAQDGSGQGELFDTWRHHGFVTNSTLGMVQADQYHRGHAVIEQTIADLKHGPLAHLPSGSYAANAAWVACAVMAFNLARAAAVAAGMAKARFATVLLRLIRVPARATHHARRTRIRLPDQWPWQPAWANLWHALHATGPPEAVPAT